MEIGGLYKVGGENAGGEGCGDPYQGWGKNIGTVFCWPRHLHTADLSVWEQAFPPILQYVSQ